VRKRALWMACAVVLDHASALASTPPCVARARLDPPTAFTGQQVLWKVQIDSRDDVAEISWIDTPAFANIRTERLPGLPVARREVPPETENDAWSRYTTREEQRALFAERAGRLPVTTAGLQCKLNSGLILETPVPTVTLKVLAVPESGRPEGFAGVIGPLMLQTHAASGELELGSTVQVTLSIRGKGNLWDVGDLLARWNPTRADVFARKPQLELRAGTQLSVQKIYRYDVVPRDVGPFAIPPVELSYFDPLRARYLIARSPGVEINVSPRKAATDRALEPDVPRAAKPPAQSGPSLLIPALGLCVAATVGGGLWQWRRGARQRSPSAATHDRDARDRARALREALAAYRDPHHAATGPSLGPLESSNAPVGVRSASNRRANAPSDLGNEAARLLETLERSRFDPGTEAPAPATIERAITRLTDATHRRA
jgi:hypothetical protein